MGAYSRWALIRGWALIRINTVFRDRRLSEKVHATIPTIIVGVALWPGGNSAYGRGGDARWKF